MAPQFDYLKYNQDDTKQNRYAVVIFLPQHLDEIIAPLRERYDPIYNLVASHITLVFPFETARSLDEIAGHIQRVAARQAPIHIELESIGDYYPTSPVIYWKVKYNEELCNLYFRLHSGLGLPVPHKKYDPHVTVAREISHHRVMFVKDKIVSYLPREGFFARSIDLISPMVTAKWVSIRSFTLDDSSLKSFPE